MTTLDDAMLSERQVDLLTNLGRITRFKLRDPAFAKARGLEPFPQPYTLPGMKWKAWKRSEIDAWLERNLKRGGCARPALGKASAA